MTPITFTSEQPQDYAAALSKVRTLGELRTLTADWRPLAADAAAVVDAMQESDFAVFLRGLNMERRGRFAGEDWVLRFGAIALPATMLVVSGVAVRYGAPWGCAFLRMQDAGAIVKNGDGTFTVKKA